VALADAYAASLDPRVIAQITAAIHAETANVYTEGTTIASGSNGQALPQATVNVAAVSALFGAVGQFVVIINGAAVTINYTGTGATTFTGCSGGTGTLATGQRVTLANHTARAAFANQVAGGQVNLAPLILDACSFAALTAASTDTAVSNAVASLWNEWAAA
jgi:hypothetical protein